MYVQSNEMFTRSRVLVISLQMQVKGNWSGSPLKPSEVDRTKLQQTILIQEVIIQRKREKKIHEYIHTFFLLFFGWRFSVPYSPRHMVGSDIFRSVCGAPMVCLKAGDHTEDIWLVWFPIYRNPHIFAQIIIANFSAIGMSA